MDDFKKFDITGGIRFWDILILDFNPNMFRNSKFYV